MNLPFGCVTLRTCRSAVHSTPVTWLSALVMLVTCAPELKTYFETRSSGAVTVVRFAVRSYANEVVLLARSVREASRHFAEPDVT